MELFQRPADGNLNEEKENKKKTVDDKGAQFSMTKVCFWNLKKETSAGNE